MNAKFVEDTKTHDHLFQLLGTGSVFYITSNYFEGDFSMKRLMSCFLAAIFGVVLVGCGPVVDEEPSNPNTTEATAAKLIEKSVQTNEHTYDIYKLVDELEHPWGIAFLPDGEHLLVTERPGRLNVISRLQGTVQSVRGIPEVHTQGQGGMLDVELHPDFPAERWVYLTYSASNGPGASTTYLGRGELVLENDKDAPRLENYEVLHVVEPYFASNAHYGSRVIFDDNDMLYMSTGDRRFKNFGSEHIAQNTTNGHGAILRLTLEGEVPEDNPFVENTDVLDTIYTYGHRNVQGMTLNPETGKIWISEHGERDGDEINLIRGGNNYGWPVAHTGCEYGTEIPVGEHPEDRDDIFNPVYYWECTSGGFPPAGATFYSGDAFPNWQGDLLIGNLAGQLLGHFKVDGTDVEEIDSHLDGHGWRIRDVKEAPFTGHLYVIVDAPEAGIYRLVPAEN